MYQKEMAKEQTLCEHEGERQGFKVVPWSGLHNIVESEKLCQIIDEETSDGHLKKLRETYDGKLVF